MSKSDEIRRMRERQFAQREEAAGRAASPTPVATAPAASAPAASAPAAAAPTEAAEQGKCAVCGKVRALSGGLVAVHQKGLGKVCAGSRKPPA